MYQYSRAIWPTQLIVLIEIALRWEFTKRIFTIRNCVIFIMIVAVAVLTGYLQHTVLWNQIARALNKSVNYSGRGTLWLQAIEKVKQSPIIGYGAVEAAYSDFSFFSSGSILTGFSTHDGYLRLLLEGGIVELLLYINIYYTLAKKHLIRRKKNLTLISIIIAIVGMGVVFIFEAEYFSTMYILILGIYWSEGRRNDGDYEQYNSQIQNCV